MVDEAALLAALRERRIAGAGLEVFQTEPVPADSPFWDLPNVIITPHIGGYVVEYEDFVVPLVVDNMRLFFASQQAETANIVGRVLTPAPAVFKFVQGRYTRRLRPLGMVNVSISPPSPLANGSAKQAPISSVR